MMLYFVLAPPMLEKSQSIKLLGLLPHVLPADAEKFSIYKEIEFKVSLPVAYRTKQCDTITVPQATTFAWRLERAVIRRNIRQSSIT